MALKQKLVELIALAELTTAPRVAIGEADVSGFTSATVFIRMGRTVTDAHTAAIDLRIELSPDRTGNRWAPYKVPSDPGVGSSVAEQAISGACLAGQKVIAMTDTTGFVAGDVVFIENTTMKLSEFSRVKVISANTSITIEDDLVNAQTGSTVRDQANISKPEIVDVKSSARLRVVVDGKGAAYNFAADAQVLLSK